MCPCSAPRWKGLRQARGVHKNDHHCEVVQPVCAGIHCAGGKDPHYPVCVPHNMSRWAQGDGVASWHVHDHMLVYLHTKNL